MNEGDLSCDIASLVRPASVKYFTDEHRFGDTNDLPFPDLIHRFVPPDRSLGTPEIEPPTIRRLPPNKCRVEIPEHHLRLQPTLHEAMVLLQEAIDRPTFWKLLPE